MRRPLYLLPVAALLGLSALPLPTAAALTTGTLPGGTTISVSIDSPADGASLPPGPVTLTGQADVGAGTVRSDAALVYVLDLSGSTIPPDGTVPDCTGHGDVTVIACEIAAARTLNQQAITLHTVGQVGEVAFGTNAVIAHVSPTDSTVKVTGPATDADNRNGPDIEQVLSSAVVGPAQSSITEFPPVQTFESATNFNDAVMKATDVVNAFTVPNRIVIFMSDGAANTGGSIATSVTNLHNTRAHVFSFAIGARASCDSTGENGEGSLAQIAGNGGNCQRVSDLSRLPNVLPAVIASQLKSLKLKIDDAPDSDDIQITNVTLPQTGATVTLPRNGPTTVNYGVTTPPLAPGNHKLCVRADGSDVGDESGNRDGHVTECHTVHINEPPVVSAGGPYSGTQGNPISIAGTVSDPDGPFPTSISWSILSADTPDHAFCVFGDTGSLSTFVTCSQHGTYTLTLTASDGLHPPVSSSTTVTVINQAPKVSAGGPYRGNQNNAVPIVGTVTDPDGPSLTTTWSIEAGTDVPTPFHCTFGDAAALSTTVTCDQHGTYRLTLTANDSVNAPVAATAEVTFINVPPTVSAGGPYKGNEDNQVPIVGTVTDPDGPSLTTTWTIEAVNDGSVPAGSVCTFANPNALSTTVSCTDRGNYTLTLTATDGLNPPVTATASLTLFNVPPTVSAGGPYTGEEDHPVTITGTVADPDSPGLTTTWTIKPNLGTAICSFTDPGQLSTVVTCSEPGVYTLTLTADDKVNPPVVATAVVSLSLTPGALSLISSVAPAPGYVGGDAIVVTQTVHNAGPAAMPGVRLVTTLPTGMQPTAVDLAGCTAASCDLGTLAPGQTVQVRFSFSPSATVDTLVSATVTTPGPDLDRGDNSGSVRVVIRQPTLTIDPSTGPQGFVTHATGKDFPPGARVRLQWSIGISETPGEVTVRPDGTLDAQALVFPKDVRGLRNLQAVPVSGPNFGTVTSNQFLVFLPSLKPLSFVIR